MTEVIKPIPSRIKSGVVGGYVTGAADIIDDDKNMSQAAINAAVDTEIGDDETEGSIKGRIKDLEESIGPGGSVEEQIQAAIAELDATESQTAGTDGLALSVTEVDGVITGISGSIATNTYDAYGAASTAKSEVIDGATTSGNTLKKLEDRVSPLETAIGTGGSVDTRIANAKSEIIGDAATDYNTLGKLEDKIQEEVTARGTAITNLIGDAASDYNTLGKLEDAIQAEATARGNADTAIDGRLDNVEEVIPSAATSSNQLADKAFVNSSISTATAEYQGNYNSVSDLELTVSATHAQIATALGTEISGADNNDYCFVQIPTSDATPTQIAKIERYKFNGTAWSYEYELNNSGFTADQWAAINSGITSNLVTAFGNKYDKPSTGIPSTDMSEAVQTSLGKADTALQEHQDISGKADKTSTVSTVEYDGTNKKITKTINGTTTDVVSVSTLKTDLNLAKADVGLSNVGNFKAVSTDASQGLTDTEQGNARANIGAGTYSKPSGGIPDTDLSSAVQTSLGLADSALQSVPTASDSVLGGIKVGTNLSIDSNGVLSATDTTYSDFVGSGSSHAHGLVPDPGATAGTTKYLREDGTWAVPEGGNDTDINYDTTNKKITKTVDNVTSDVVTAATLVSDGGGIEVEIGETAPAGDVKLFVDEDADPAVTLDVYTREEIDQKIAFRYDSTTKGLVFPTDTSIVEYDSTNHAIVFHG